MMFDTLSAGCACDNTSKQRVIDKYVVGYGTEYQFKLSVTPHGYPDTPDIIVIVNGNEVKHIGKQTYGYGLTVINEAIYVDLEAYLTKLLETPQTQAPSVEIQTYTYDLLDPAATGYFEIPQQLEANPTQLEIGDISATNLIGQFSSIIKNQKDFTGIEFGGSNNYKDSPKNTSLGNKILQNVSPALKCMLVSSSDDLDVIKGIRFSQDEYTKFKNKYLRTAQQLINQEFHPLEYHNNTVVIAGWVDEILKTINISKEHSNAFAYSYMLASGAPVHNEAIVVPVSGNVLLTNYVDLSDDRNAIYVYNTTVSEKLLLIGVDYEITSTNSVVELQFKPHVTPGDSIEVVFYKDPMPAYVPSTPAKIGAYKVSVPRIVYDTSYAEPTHVIVGHDGSRTIAYSSYIGTNLIELDYRDTLLLELETRIYNLIKLKYRNEYFVPLRLEEVKSGYFRNTRYSREEFLNITESYINKWSAKNRANYRLNEWASFSIDPAINSTNIWKLYNYRDAVNTVGSHLNLPGNWKGIFQYYYDTFRPDTAPWEMLGFTDMPSWWVSVYGAAPYTSANTALWQDLEAGIIRQGPSAIFDVNTLLPLPQPMWARPGLSYIIPVDSSGNIRSVIDIFSVATSGNIYEPFDGFDKDWVYGDGAPVEQAWMSTSEYAFSTQEFLYLMRPGPFGELLWNTLETEQVPASVDLVGMRANRHWQYVQTSTNMRPTNASQQVHGETIDNVVQIKYGYQRWVSDRILFLGKDVGDTFGQKVRTLDVNLANKFAGFTNKDTVNTYIESVAYNSTTSGLAIPSNNFDVVLYKGQPVKTYSYSGVIIRALESGQFVVYGYDLLNSEFITLNRSDAELVDISVGGEPVEYRVYTVGDTYQRGEYVRYNGVYYVSLATQVAGKFDATNWHKLKSLPVTGGISVTYRPISETSKTRVPYGSVLNSAQEVFDMLIGWGAYLESQGWKFDNVNADTNQVSDWLYCAKQFLFWLNTNWAPDASIQLSPAANSATLEVQQGYPDDVETMSNGVYSILDKRGVAIPSNNTVTDRSGQTITVSPADLASGGIYFLQVHSSETEHVLIFDNTTSFADIIYSPLLRERQDRLRYYGFRSNGWYGKMEAPGYLVIDNQLVPNYDTIVDAMRYYYDPDVAIDNTSLEDLGRRLIGYESKSYLDNLQVTNDVQYLFYQGAIRQKGTSESFNKLFRSTQAQSNESIKVYEEWALKLGEFGNTVEQVSTEFNVIPEQNSGEVVVARLNFVPSDIGFVKQINVVNAVTPFTDVPKIVISAPDATPASFTNFSLSAEYFVGDVVRYDTIPGVYSYYSSNIIQGPDASLPTNTTAWTKIAEYRKAKAYAILDSSGYISRIDINDAGTGYLSAPTVYPETGNGDVLSAVWQGNIIKDAVSDNVIEIDIDDTKTWVSRPTNPQYSLEFPVTDKIDYYLPNAGYVSFDDVTWTSFNVSKLFSDWGTKSLNPVVADTIWVAKNFVEDWNVYKLTSLYTEKYQPWRVIDNSGLFLILDEDITISSQLSTSPLNRTDLGNVICLQAREKNSSTIISNYVVRFSDAGVYTNPDTGTSYNSYALLNLDGTDLINTDLGEYTIFTDLLLFKSMRWSTKPTEPLMESHVGIGDYIWVDDNGESKWSVYKIEPEDGHWDVVHWDLDIPEFWGTTEKTVVPNNNVTLYDISGNAIGMVSPNEAVTITIELTDISSNVIGYISNTIGNDMTVPVTDIDGNSIGYMMPPPEPVTSPEQPYPPASIYTYGWDVSGPLKFTKHRVQESLINTSLFESAEIFQTSTENEIARLPIYDPFKGILPASAKQNISYISMQDPARYNVTGDTRLYSANITFAENQVGKLWWDTSDVRYVYYEQPQALDASSSTEPTKNLAYRRDHWGQIFPGSSVTMYEWVKSDVPPSSYKGSGTPKSTTDYVQVVSADRFTNKTGVSYYFWVLGATDKPNIENRTMAALEVARLITSPRSQGYSFFCPIQQTGINNSYMFYNVQELLSYKGNSIQVTYRLSERDDQEHAQWAFYREGDNKSLVSDQFWDKMVDSICGYTKMLPVTSEWKNAIIVANDLPWDIYGWDVSKFDSATTDTASVYGEVLQVPDPTLSESEKYGIEYRPRQGMFKNIYSARKVFVEATNALLKNIPLVYESSSWNPSMMSNKYWDYTDWSATGYEDAVPTVAFKTYDLAATAVSLKKYATGTIVEVVDGLLDLSTNKYRYELYVIEEGSSGVQTLTKVGTENATIKLLSTVYTDTGKYLLSTDLRALLGLLRSEIFVNAYIVNQNSLFFSMLNYVMSEQKTPNWLFKSSYIYVKEDNKALTQDKLYKPNQLDNVIKYIDDVKPYHTQIRDFTSTYLLSDLADGYPSDVMKSKIKLRFTPDIGGPYEDGHWETDVTGETPVGWDTESWDVLPNNYENILDAGTVSGSIANALDTGTDTIDISADYDASKKGLSQLTPYTFTVDVGTYISPASIVAIKVDDEFMIYGEDYYAEYNGNNSYTVYFFNPPMGISIIAYILWDAGNIARFPYNTNRTEIAYGYASDDFVMKVRTRLPVNRLNGVDYPLAPWGTTATGVDPVIASIVGQTVYNPALPIGDVIILNNEISYRENLSVSAHTFYRNADVIPYNANKFTNAALTSVWNATNASPDPATEITNDAYTSIVSASAGGLWYADTSQSAFLKAG